jgi:hypothetical protein
MRYVPFWWPSFAAGGLAVVVALVAVRLAVVLLRRVAHVPRRVLCSLCGAPLSSGDWLACSVCSDAEYQRDYDSCVAAAPVPTGRCS